MKDYTIQTFDFLTASREDWNRYHRYRRKRSLEIFPDDPVDDDEQYEEWSKFGLDENEKRAYVAITTEEPKEIVASLVMTVMKENNPSYEGNEHLVVVNSLTVLEAHQRRGIAKEFLKLVHKFAVDMEKPLIVGHALDEGGRKLGQLVGGTESLNMRVNRLDLDEVDWSQVENWEKEGRERSPDSHLEFHLRIPDDILGLYCKKYTEIYNQMPLQDLDAGDLVITPDVRRKHEETYEKTGEQWWTAIIREIDGDISGLTDIVYNPSNASLISQALTGVDPKYRGQGKGKWLKAAMLLKIRDEFPNSKTISTSNASTNAPMIAINDRLGFKLKLEVYFVQVETDTLGKYIAGD